MNDYIKKSVEYAFDNKLADMQDNIQAAIREKISTAIDAKKVEVAQGMFGVAESVGDDDDCGEEDEVGDLSESELKCKQKKLDKNKNGKLDAHDFKLLRKEDFSDILEMLDPSMGPEKYIHDFVHSDNPKFQGKSKKERIQMALGAYYSAKKANEEVEQIDELSVGKLDAYRKKASDDADRLDKIDARKTQNKPIGAKSSPEGHKAINRRLGAELADTKIKSKTGTYRPSMLDKVKSKLLGEEVEQIDELSTSTMGSYMQKSIAQKLSGTKDRTPGMQKAYKKMTTKKVSEAVSAKDVIADVQKNVNDPDFRKKHKGEPKKWIGPQKGDYGYPHSAGHGMDSVSGPRIRTAKKVSEEAEQIDELSVGKLDAYRKKASDDADRLDKIDARKTQNKPIGAKSSPEGHKAINRRLGAELADTKIKSKTGTYRPSMLDKVKSKLLGEEVEQIDELSKDTLGSYVKKATDAKEKNWQYADAAAKRSKTPADTKQFLKHSEKFGKRTSGLKMATDRLNKEEVEEVNEISKDTLGNYVKKASLNQAITGMAHGREWGGEKGMKKNSEKLAKRDKGIGRAVDRLTKEEAPSAVMRKKIKR